MAKIVYSGVGPKPGSTGCCKECNATVMLEGNEEGVIYLSDSRGDCIGVKLRCPQCGGEVIIYGW